MIAPIKEWLVHRGSFIAQIALLCAIWFAGDMVAKLSGLPIPGGILGLAFVLLLLLTGRVRAPVMKRGADWFLGNMLLFFIPAILAVLDHGELFGPTGLKILAVIFSSTLIVMLSTAFVVDLCYRFRAAHAGAPPDLR